MKKEFNSVQEAFAYFMENILQNLSADSRRKLKDVKYDYGKEGRKVSETRMKRVLKENASGFEVVFRFDVEE